LAKSLFAGSPVAFGGAQDWGKLAGMTTQSASKPGDHQILTSQLCIGLYIHLDLPWTEHPFSFSSFRIKNLDQIATIQSLGLDRVRYSPDKSEAEPLQVPAKESAGNEPAAIHHEADPAAHAKLERLERIAAHHAKINSCERDLMSKARSLKSINHNLFARPEEAHKEAQALVDSIADSMLVDTDMAIHLMVDKVGGEDAYHHALNVAIMSMMLAREMSAPAAAVRLIGLGALLHDVGKIDIPDRILHKTSGLTRPELALLHQHCATGVGIASRMGVPREALLIIEQHHERVDGSGYPNRLHGEQLTLLSKIVAVVNAYDNLCNPLDPGRALTPHEALSIMYGQQRAGFDAKVMASFVRSVGIYPPGTVVVLSNGTIGLVVSVNSSKPLKPTVLVYDPAVPKASAMVVDLEQEPEVAVSKTLKPQSLPQAVHDYLSPRKRITYFFEMESGKAVG
jgi:putative nucleotidyltransferase with HDIG domain